MTPGGAQRHRILEAADALTSYAGRDLNAVECAVKVGTHAKNRVLICDDSDDHHKGIVVGMASGVVRFWDVADRAQPSSVKELQCQRSD